MADSIKGIYHKYMKHTSIVYLHISHLYIARLGDEKEPVKYGNAGQDKTPEIKVIDS